MSPFFSEHIDQVAMSNTWGASVLFFSTIPVVFLGPLTICSGNISVISTTFTYYLLSIFINQHNSSANEK